MLRARRAKDRAQALVEFAFILPVTLILLLGMIDFGRAFVFGIAVQGGAKDAARLAAKADYDTTVTDGLVWGRLFAASAPALVGCTANSGTQTCGGGTWTFSMSVVTPGGATYSTISAARSANALAGSRVTITSNGSIGLLPGFETGQFNLRLPQINVQGQATMVIL
jgi:Flp pilus assembly protein TadG